MAEQAEQNRAVSRPESACCSLSSNVRYQITDATLLDAGAWLCMNAFAVVRLLQRNKGVTIRSRRSAVQAGSRDSQPLSASRPLRSTVKFTGRRQIRP